MKRANAIASAIFVIMAFALCGAWAQPSSSAPEDGTNAANSAETLLRSIEEIMEAEGAAMDLRQELMSAVMKDDLSALKKAESKGANLLYRDPMSGTTILTVASYWGAVTCVPYLIKKGLSMQDTTTEGLTNLCMVALLDRAHLDEEYASLRKSKARLMEHLLANGYSARKHLVYLVQYTVAHLAAECDNAEVLEALKKGGVNIDEPSLIQKARPLSFAAKSGQLETVMTLVILGADIQAETDFGQSPLDMAIAGENEPVIEYLMSLGAKRGTLGRIVDEATEEALAMAMEGEAAYEADTGLRLVEAVANRDHEAIKTLLRGGTDVNGQYHGMTPLIASISREGDLSTLGFLLQNGADPNAPAESGMTPLASACMASRADAVRALLKAGARVNDPAIGGMPAMEFAKMENNEEIMSILKKAGAKP